uniref:ubiquitinyl hydrolase 1 n=1 Tax=viral metagenome TaxID=1070528 RepID=A0A6C0CR95_9ZZZZ
MFSFINLGNTCFFNSALQCLLAIRMFREIIVNMSHCTNYYTFFMKALMTQTVHQSLNVSDLYSHYLTDFKLQRNHPEDTSECLSHLIDQLSDSRDTFARRSDVTSACQCHDFWQRTSTSWIDDMFTGLFGITKRYECCRHVTQHFETFRSLVFYTDQVNGIMSCLMSYLKEETIDGVQCERCEQRTRVCTYNTFHRLPPVLIFDLINTGNTLQTIEQTIHIEHRHGMPVKYVYDLKCIVLYVSQCHYKCIVFNDNIVYNIDDTRIEIIPDLATMNLQETRLLIYERG